MPCLLPSVTLMSGAQMPLLGLGTYKLQGTDQLKQSVSTALQAGYRAFDTGAVYGNEAHLGQVLRELLPKYGLSRKDVFIISKLAPSDHGPRAKEGCLSSLEQLGCEYIDLYLVHWPGVEGLDQGDSRHSEYRAQSWTALEEFYASRKFKDIGVSNYTAEHIRELLMTCHVPPAVLQMECQPKLIQRELRDVCMETGIHFQAYSSLGKGALLREPEVMAIARSCGRTPAQVLLRWAVQQGISVLPRSSQPCRINENSQVFDFDLSESNIKRLDALNCGTRFCKRDSSNIA
ncbi:uncharacterized oxidoreductase YtbE [Myxocyprinus asiaticus]|uniref:uncharacterized oxidoreductase YtbE n=1 Tax=Myxocyprinus asiaticus TaxID=70543 RepID=UPI00222198EF|nr:uncharacterized oxidoreductase YtbE [Myxocyprinus asiaticus]XP_051536276.1 uncharacterized oxidoreductase YtbE [Myxocyprinus asiaticus]XP_051536277.1 uncharacterized oxidoreductase YtbE [Myxocyprinus asiaticus]XP_051536278.1 uncharacterized oxidoreductase YtbE [Myxocyprinus asiaticus]